MLEFMPESERNILGIRASGTLTDVDYRDVLIPRLEKMFGDYGRLRILFYMDAGFVGWDLSAAWDDAAMALKHRADFEKLAVVGGPEWVAWCIRLSAFLISGEIALYPADKLQDAWNWMKAA